MDATLSGSLDRRPIWETWEIDGHYFMGLWAGLWGIDEPGCMRSAIPLLTWNGGECFNFNHIQDGNPCTAGGSSDNYGISDCDAGTNLSNAEMCGDHEGYAKSQMAALENLVTTVTADSDAKSLVFFSHMTPWTAQNAQSQDNDWGVIHNSKQCNDGDLQNEPYDICYDFDGAFKCPIAGRTCDAPVAVTEAAGANAGDDYDWRNQIEQSLLGLTSGMVTNWIAGHSHVNDSPTRSPSTHAGPTTNGVEYNFWRVVGTSNVSPNVSQEVGGQDAYYYNFLSALYVHIDDNGTVTDRFIHASEHGGGIYGGGVFNGNIPRMGLP